MNKLILIILVIFLSQPVNSQQSELLSETWYLTKIVEDDIEYYTPEPWENFINARLQFHEFVTDDFYLVASICLHEVLMDLLIVSDEEFTSEYIDDTMMECAPYIPYYQEFEGNYVGFWRSFPEGANSPFTYEISEENGTLSLIVTNNKGDKTYYYNEELSTIDYSKDNLNFYPNPIKDKLIIENPDLKITSVSIADVSGKTVFSSKQFQSTKIEIDFKSFPKGAYFLTTELDGKTLMTEKVLKK